jgi:uncharacterized protein (DUF1330 family)
MPAYIIAESTILDVKAFEIYRRRAEASVVEYGGRYLARGGEIEVLEGECAPRVVLLEFPSMDAARLWYRSPEYAKALDVRDQALSRNLFLVDGVAPSA